MNKHDKQNIRAGQVIRACLIMAVGLGLIGCETTPKRIDKPTAKAESVFYPEAPDTPRLQFLVSFSDDSLWKTKKGSSFSKWVVGEADTESPTYFDSPYGLAIRNGKLYICDIGRKLVHVLDLNKHTYGILGSEKTFKNPVNITIDDAGIKYVCDTVHRQILIFDQQDKYLGALGNPDEGQPMDVLPINGKLVVANGGKGQLELWSRTGELLKVLVKKGKDPGQLWMPTNLDVTNDGLILVTDTLLQMVKVFDITGRLMGTIGNPGTVPGFFARPKGVVVAPGGVIYVADAQWEVIEVFQQNGKLLMYFGGGSPEPQGLGMPAGLAIDTSTMPAFAKYVDPRFDAQYLLFVANQFGKNKISVFAYGTPNTKIDRPLPQNTVLKNTSKPPIIPEIPAATEGSVESTPEKTPKDTPTSQGQPQTPAQTPAKTP